MPRKQSHITITDQFCGAGGSSQGAKKALARVGINDGVKLALNHWKLAIETHNTNFPDTLHDCTDISACDPRRYPSTDILITSPECTNHSLAKGKKIVTAQLDLFESGKADPAAERSRATMWDVPRFAEYHNYNIIIVENVVDARKWVMFESWLHAMHALGYNHKCVYLNSQHAHPTPQSRDRMYVVFWKKGNKAPMLDYTPMAHCNHCDKDVHSVQTWKNPLKKFGKYRTQYVYCCPHCTRIVEPYYYAAFNCIDWSNLGKRIGDRKKPLSDKTIARIKYGLDKYGNQPMQIVNYSPGYARSIYDTTGTFTTSDHHSLLTPFIVNDQHSTGLDCRVRNVNDRLGTIPTQPHFKLITPFIFKEEHSLNLKNAKPVFDSLATQTTRQSYGMIVPHIVEMNRTGECKPSAFPTATFTSGGINHALLVENKGQSKSRPLTQAVGCVTTKKYLGLVSNSFISYYYGTAQATHISDALGTATTKDRHQLISNVQPKVDDCFFRMLFPHEIQSAMAFDKDYIVLGSGKDKVKQLGNAVTPPAMEWLVQQCVESLK